MNTKRRVFYSFHYDNDVWRTFEVRNIGVVEGNRPAIGNGWENVQKKDDWSIKKWIDEQMEGRSCTVVLVGEKTARRKWIDYEIRESWDKGMGVVGICIHGLKDSDHYVSNAGENPFDYFVIDGKKLSSIVNCYDPGGNDSQERYGWISEHLSNAVEEAIRIRNSQ